jgi:hypothetical protein
MKVLIGQDVGGYVFSSGDKTVTLTGLPTLTIDQILLITHVESGTILYNFADPSKGGSIVGNVLSLGIEGTLTGGTLQIWVYLKPPTETQLVYESGVLKNIYDGTYLTTLGYTNNVLTSVNKAGYRDEPAITSFVLDSIVDFTVTVTMTGNSDVVKYLITTSATPPVATDFISTTPITTYTGVAGTYNIYAWGLSALGTVSASESIEISIGTVGSTNWRINITAVGNPQDSISIGELTMYGANGALTPITVTSDGFEYLSDVWDGNLLTHAEKPNAVGLGIIEYEFANPVTLTHYELTSRCHTVAWYQTPTFWTLEQYINDAWEVMHTVVNQDDWRAYDEQLGPETRDYVLGD